MTKSPQIIISCLSILLVGCSAQSWEDTALTAEAQADPACAEELEGAMKTILFDAGLTDVAIRETHLESLSAEGRLDQSMTLYMGDQIRHWALAYLEAAPSQCTLYNHSVTRLDLATGEEDIRQRHLRGSRGQAAKFDLRICTCEPAKS